MTLLEHALGYARRGAMIFPVNETDKTPYTEHGMKDATDDPEQLDQWWRQHPDALIGCRIPEDVVVLDIDPRHKGAQVWLELERRNGTVQTERVHASGREDGGRHYWFKRGEIDKISAKPLHEWARANGLGQRSGKRGWTSGIDVLHHGWRYTILPPSPHPETGKPYRWLREGQPSPLPRWLAPLVTRPIVLPSAPTIDRQSDSIADWYTATARWADILVGWTVVDGDGETDGSKWRHPSATAASSASIRYGCLFVYTPNTDLEETEDGDPRGYTKFRAWAELFHDGDLRAAASAARQQRDGPTIEPRTLDKDSDDLLALLVDWPTFWKQDHSAEEWIAWPLIPAQRQTALFAPAKEGKSLIALAVVAAVATGRDILGQRATAGPRHVLYLDYEMTDSDLHERLEDLGYGPDDDLTHLHYALLPSLPPLNTALGCKALRTLAALVDAEVVVIDTLGRAVVGEENSADSYRDFARLTGLLLKADGRAVLRTDHAGKKKDLGQRGSSAKNDDVDVVLRIDRVQGGWSMTRTHTRIPWVPERVTINREEVGDLVRLTLGGVGRPYAEGTDELVELLRSLGVTAGTSTRDAAAILRDAGAGRRNKHVLDALRWLREEAPTYLQEAGNTPGNTQPGHEPDTDRVAEHNTSKSATGNAGSGDNVRQGTSPPLLKGGVFPHPHPTSHRTSRNSSDEQRRARRRVPRRPPRRAPRVARRATTQRHRHRRRRTVGPLPGSQTTMSSYAENLRELAAKGMMNTTVLRGAADEIDEAWALADDLAAAYERPGYNIEIQKALARYREARQR